MVSGDGVQWQLWPEMSPVRKEEMGQLMWSPGLSCSQEVPSLQGSWLQEQPEEDSGSGPTVHGASGGNILRHNPKLSYTHF